MVNISLSVIDIPCESVLKKHLPNFHVKILKKNSFVFPTSLLSCSEIKKQFEGP